MNNKKTLNIMTFYTLVGVMVAFAVFFCVFLWSSTTTPDFARIAYTIITVLLVGTTIFNIVSVNMNELRGIVGYILYFVTLINIIASFIFYGLISNNGALVGNELSLFTIILALSYGINILAIIIYAMGNTVFMKNQRK